MKVEIKLHPDLASQGLGFTDTQGKQELRHEAGKSIIVKRTPFVNLKIQSGEVTLVKTIEEETKEEKKEAETSKTESDAAKAKKEKEKKDKEAATNPGASS